MESGNSFYPTRDSSDVNILEENMNNKIVTYTGKVFDFLDPQPEMVCIEDIAHALANICRYTGHVRKFYSVAQHCVLMADAYLPGDPLQKLLHDAAEAYVGDMASPWKQLLRVYESRNCCTKDSGFSIRVNKYEQKIQDIIGIALGVNLSYSAETKEADNRMFFTEVRDLMPPSEEFKNWKGNLAPLDFTIVPWDSDYSETAFLNSYWGLKTLCE